MGDQRNYAVILAGGKGERFWPLSTSGRPKQLLSLLGDRSLIGQAVDRIDSLIPPENVFVITSSELVEATRKAVPELPPENIIGEPMGRDTAAAVALGAVLVKSRNPDAAFCVMTADHIIGNLDLFRQTLDEGLSMAHGRDVLITIGIKPDSPSTGYGYIEAGEPVHSPGEIEFYKAEAFVEKPDLDTAKTYLDAGCFYWNSGMFIWSVQALEKALRRHASPLADMMDRLQPAIGKKQYFDLLRSEYESLEKISIDYALMEKADNIVMAKGVFPWDDVGSWPALENHFEADSAGNIIIGNAEHIDCTDNIVYSADRLTALVGVENVVVVQAEGVTLVCSKDRAHDIKKLVEQIRDTGRYDDLL